MLRVVHDTNVAVSALVFREGRLAWLRRAWAAGTVRPVVSRESVAELVRVLGYPKLKLADEEARLLLANYLDHAEVNVKPAGRQRLPECRDPDDVMLLALAYSADADALVTGDRDLLDIAAQSRVPILTPEALHARL